MAGQLYGVVMERGNGFPEPGRYIPAGDGGELLRVVAYDGSIHTDRPRYGNYIYATVEEASWDDCPEDEVFEAAFCLESEGSDDDDDDAYMTDEEYDSWASQRGSR
jgi:hypothetical protein